MLDKEKYKASRVKSNRGYYEIWKSYRIVTLTHDISANEMAVRISNFALRITAPD